MATRAAASGPAGGRDVASEVAFLARALKAPTLAGVVPRLAERARAESWTHEEFLVGVSDGLCRSRDRMLRRVPREGADHDHDRAFLVVAGG